MIRVLGHLGIWAGLYALAAFVCFAQLAGMVSTGIGLPRWEGIACVFLTATAVYSIDRVKLLSRWLDPADVAAQPERYAFLTKQNGRVRLFAGALLLVAAAIGCVMSPIAPVVVVFAAMSTAAYAPTARGKIARIKDRLWLKNAYVAVGMTGFAAFFVLVSANSGGLGEQLKVIQGHWLPLGIVFGVVSLRIFFDAALCDIDDEPTDRQFRTETFATAVGTARVWNWAGLGRVALAIGLPFAIPLPGPARIAWALAMLLGMAALRWSRPERIRDTVDIRFIPEAIFATVAIYLWAAFAATLHVP